MGLMSHARDARPLAAAHSEPIQRWPHLAAGVAAALAIGFASTPARAHGDAAWIMANPLTRHCCGPDDCREIPAEHVRLVGEIYFVDDPPLAWNSNYGTYASINSNYWACVTPDGRVKCFFAPVMGS
jgi:hypothetical protein